MILSVGESRPKKFKVGAALIKAFEGLDHTHSFISWRDDFIDVRKVAESRGSGGRLLINTQFKAENHVVRVFQYEISPGQAKELERWLWDHLKPYGHKHLLGLAMMRVEKLWNKEATNRLKDGDFSMICVEMTAKAIEIALGIDLPGNVEDYGLREMHNINYANVRLGVCKLMEQETVDKINAR